MVRDSLELRIWKLAEEGSSLLCTEDLEDMMRVFEDVKSTVNVI